MEDCTVTKEALHSLCSKMAVLIGETEKLMIGDGFETDDDQYAYMLNSYNYYKLVNQIYRTRIEHLPPKLKVPCKYEIFAVLNALAISVDAMASQDLIPANEKDRFYDPDWIKSLAVTLREHYKETAKQNNYILPQIFAEYVAMANNFNKVQQVIISLFHSCIV